MRDTQRERKRQKHRQRQKQVPCREPDVGLDPGTPGSHPGRKADAQALSHPGAPSIPFYSPIIFYHVDKIFYLCLSMHQMIGSWSKLSCFHFGATRNNAAMNVFVQISVRRSIFISLGYILGVELLGQMVTLCLTILRNWQTISRSDCIILYSHPQTMVPVSPHFTNTCYGLSFLF